MTAFTLKIIALISMFADHLAVVFPCCFPVEFRAVGRLAWPVFAYLLAEGFRYSKAPDKFLIRLFIVAIISQIPYSLAILGTQGISFISGTNIFYTLFLGGAAIVIYKRLEAQGKKLTAYLAAVLPSSMLAEFLSSEYGGMGVLFIFTMYAITEKRLQLAAMGFFALSQFFPVMLPLTHLEFTHLLMMCFALSTVGLVALYNGKRGFSATWLFYVAYPIHLSALAAAAVLFNL